MGLIELVKERMDADRRELEKHTKVAKISLPGILECNKRKTGEIIYRLKDKTGKRKYLNKRAAGIILRIKEQRFSEEMEKILKANIDICEMFVKGYKDSPQEYVESILPMAYKRDDRVNQYINEKDRNQMSRCPPPSENPFMREHLKIKTTFGLMVRSKAEAAIGEILNGIGIPWYYEKGIRLSYKNGIIEGETITTTFYPDFTVVPAIGGPVYIEHKGMLWDRAYAERDLEKTLAYSQNGIVQPINLIVTSDPRDGGTDLEAIKLALERFLLPLK